MNLNWGWRSWFLFLLSIGFSWKVMRNDRPERLTREKKEKIFMGSWEILKGSNFEGKGKITVNDNRRDRFLFLLPFLFGFPPCKSISRILILWGQDSESNLSPLGLEFKIQTIWKFILLPLINSRSGQISIKSELGHGLFPLGHSRIDYALNMN